MPEELKPPRCDAGRVTPDPCPNPPVYEICAPVPFKLCRECAEERLDEDLDEVWKQLGEATYVAELDDAIQVVRGLESTSTVLHLIAEAIVHPLEQELWRARRALYEAGGKPEPTAAELKKLHDVLDMIGGYPGRHQEE